MIFILPLLTNILHFYGCIGAPLANQQLSFYLEQWIFWQVSTPFYQREMLVWPLMVVWFSSNFANRWDFILTVACNLISEGTKTKDGQYNLLTRFTKQTIVMAEHKVDNNDQYTCKFISPETSIKPVYQIIVLWRTKFKVVFRATPTAKDY